MRSQNLPALAGAADSVSEATINAIPISDSEVGGSNPTLGAHDILFMLFRHKWKILLCAMAGLLAAACVYFLFGSFYESQAKLLVRYVVDRSAIDGLDSSAKEPGAHENLINSELEILNSSDLAKEVAQKIGVDRLLPERGSKATLDEAAHSIVLGLTVVRIKDSNIISVSYRNHSPKLATEVLQELVKRYFDKHLEIHRSAGAFEFVSRQADQLRAELNETEEELKQLKAKAGVTSLAESTTATATELTKAQEELDAAEAELAAQKARVDELERSLGGVETKQSENAVPQVGALVTEQYQTLVNRVAQLRQSEADLLSRYTSQNRIVKVKQTQIEDLEKQRRSLEKKYPGLIATMRVAGPSESPRPDLVSERALLMAAEAKAEALRSRLSAIRGRSKTLSELGPQIGQLERKREVEEANYKYFGASLEKARIDETLDPSRMPNISVVQQPAPGEKVTRNVQKIVFGLAAGGIAIGIAIALLIELVLDRTVKRSLELETRLQIPLLLSIPYFGPTGQRLRLRDAGHDSETDGDESIAPASDTGDVIRPFCEAIRDRLGLFFELNRMTHKPKLVAVTGLSKNAGASTLAAGLTATLSEGSDGKVLLVDKPVAPKRFYEMLTQFKASDLDYVVFDMPSLGDTSATLPLAGFMDKVLLVVEAEKSNRDSIKRAYSQLSARADVSVIFNKSRSYGPKWLEGEL